jgi:hypothetical protein
MKRRLWMMLMLLSGSALAHPVDECVQAAYLTLAANQISLELDLTPGELVAGKLIGLLDANHDKTISNAEAESFARTVLQKISLEVDGQVQELKLNKTQVPALPLLESGGGTVRIDAQASLALKAGDHQFRFYNAFKPVKSGYLANVFVQSGSLSVLKQSRDQSQSEFIVDYKLEQAPTPAGVLWLLPVALVTLMFISLFIARQKPRKSL